ncbi:N-acetylglucosamine-6-phosphate deacetylase [Brevibacterium renqingii]|uniref:N-acetylglucosamine-6-phosphate deacetylase n=1 Tax=Brevibacterium renqingii TaxID=2776916 RepID=UPI001ADF46BF|nr:amidohydrolase family protein [Brevibacterium renqingii]
MPTAAVAAELVIHDTVVLDGEPSRFQASSADTWLAVTGGEVIARGRGAGWKDLLASPDARIIDGAAGYVAPAYVDIHCHGAGGASAEDGRDGLEEILAVHRAHGTRGLALSYVSDTIDGLCRALAEGADAARERPGIIGLHAEGPFLSRDFKGAHAPEVLTAPTPDAVERILTAADGRLVQITLAPELPGALDAIARFTSAGVRVAIGHTAADYAQTAAAFDDGASILTHAFNGMPGIHHRAPGPILAAVEAAHVSLELINDGVHVSGPAARMISDLAPGRIVLITDAMSATGMSDGRYELGSLPVVVEDSVARLVTADGSPGSIAGSTLTMDEAVKRAVAEVGLSPFEAVRAATSVPLRALGLDPSVDGDLLAVGMPADFLLLDPDMGIRESWIAG